MVLNPSFNELVFENRHKDYGAYQIRKRYSKNVLLSGFLAVSLFAIAIGAYFINMPEANALLALKKDHKVDTTIVIIGPMKEKEKDKEKDHAKVKPLPPKGPSSSNTSNIVITKDSVAPMNQNDTAGRSPRGIVGGTGQVKDSVKTTGIPCPECDTVKPRLVTWLQNPPKDPGLDEFFRKNIRYPQSAKDANIEGTVWLSFIVDTKGNVRQIEIAKGVDPSLDREVLRVAKFMPKWDPITDNGDPVEFLYRKPIRFLLGK